jgi:hypothetical protein
VVRDLFPFKINRAVVKNGSIHLRAKREESEVDIYVADVNAVIDNLTNILDETEPLIATVQCSGRVMDQARWQCTMAIDPFAYHPTFHLATRVLGLDVTKINGLAREYGWLDFERGWLDLVVEADAQEGQLSGYVKPLFRDLKVFSPTEDIRAANLLGAFWQAIAGISVGVLKNPSRHQFGTLIPFSGNTSGTTEADMFATIANIFRNAFVRAYLPRLEKGKQSLNGLEFAPAEFTEALAVDSVD